MFRANFPLSLNSFTFFEKSKNLLIFRLLFSITSTLFLTLAKINLLFTRSYEKHLGYPSQPRPASTITSLRPNVERLTPRRQLFSSPSFTSSTCFTPQLRLFQLLARIHPIMSAVHQVWAIRSEAPGAASAAAYFSTFMTDNSKALAQRLKHRDPELLDRLIEQYQFRLFRYLLHLTANRERAEDFFQETWLRVLERGHQYDGKWKFEAWLFAIARNLVLDWHRRKKPQSIDSLAGPEEDATFDVKDEHCESPLEQVLQAEQKSSVQQSLEKVPAIYREVLVLRFQEEMQLDEIAGVTGAPISTVKSRLLAARDKKDRCFALVFVAFCGERI